MTEYNFNISDRLKSPATDGWPIQSMFMGFPLIFFHFFFCNQVWQTTFNTTSSALEHALHCGFDVGFFVDSILHQYVACGNSLLGENIAQHIGCSCVCVVCCVANRTAVESSDIRFSRFVYSAKCEYVLKRASAEPETKIERKKMNFKHLSTLLFHHRRTQPLEITKSQPTKKTLSKK